MPRPSISRRFPDEPVHLAWIPQVELDPLNIRPSEIDRTIKLHIELVNAIRFAVSHHFGLAIATTISGSGVVLINQTLQTQNEPEASESCV